MLEQGKMDPVSPWVELGGWNSYAVVPAKRLDGLDDLKVPASDQNASKARLESGKATPSSKSIAPSPQPIDYHRFFPAALTLALLASVDVWQWFPEQELTHKHLMDSPPFQLRRAGRASWFRGCCGQAPPVNRAQRLHRAGHV
jgi:hypothetical protein